LSHAIQCAATKICLCEGRQQGGCQQLPGWHAAIIPSVFFCGWWLDSAKTAWGYGHIVETGRFIMHFAALVAAAIALLSPML